MRSDDGLDISAYSGQQCTRIKSYPHLDAGTHTVHPHSLFSWIMGGDRFEKTLTRKQEESYQCIVRFTEEHGFPANSQGTGALLGVASNINGIFQDQAVREKSGYIRRVPASPRAIEIL